VKRNGLMPLLRQGYPITSFYHYACPYLAVLRELDRLLRGSLSQMVRAAHSLGEISHYVDKLAEPWCSSVFYETALSFMWLEKDSERTGERQCKLLLLLRPLEP
jgi:hypothetical protein